MFFLLGQSAFAPTNMPGLRLWLDANVSTITKTYQNLSATGSGTSGSTTITASGSVANLVQPGMKLRIGGTDIYTVSTVVTTTITTVETLTATYNAGSAMALDRASQWNDLSGQGNHATQATALKQPVYNPNQSNSGAVLTFDGASTLALPSALYTIPSAANTIFVTAKQTVNGGGGVSARIVDMSEGGGTNFRYYISFSSTASTLIYANSTSGALTSSTGTSANTSFQIIMGQYDGGTNQGVAYNNGAQSVNNVGAGSAESGCDSAYIGSASDSGRYLTGAIKRILIWNRALSASEIIKVNRYCAALDAITLS